MYYIGIDIGGTNMKIGVLNEDAKLCCKTSIPFVTGGEQTADALRDGICALLRENGISISEIASIGIVIPGSIDSEGRTVIDAHNLGFHNVPFPGIVEKRFEGIPVYMANDADGAALAELYAGAFIGCKTAVLITLGTGVGGGTILGGRLFNGGMHHGSELGHIYLIEGGEGCTCGNLGCAESYCSATALAREGKKAAALHPESRLAAFEKIDARCVIDCAKDGDPTAEKVFAEYLQHLASLCASVFNLLDPEVLAIGGGVCGAGDFLFSPLQQLVTDRCFYHEKRGRLVPAVLGNDAGMIGAAMLHRNAIMK